MADPLSRLADAAAVALFGDAARRLPFAVTPRMKEIASATAAPARSLIVAAYIVGTGVLHSRGTFSATLRGEGAARNASLLGLVDAMVARSPGLCAPGTSLVIVHNVDVADGLRGGVEYVRVAADGLLGRMAPNSARFVLIDRVLRTHPRYADRWACAFAVDLADVDVLRAPPCAALRDDELVVGQDGCGAKLGGWLAGRARRSGLLEHELNGSSRGRAPSSRPSPPAPLRPASIRPRSSAAAAPPSRRRSPPSRTSCAPTLRGAPPPAAPTAPSHSGARTWSSGMQSRASGRRARCSPGTRTARPTCQCTARSIRSTATSPTRRWLIGLRRRGGGASRAAAARRAGRRGCAACAASIGLGTRCRAAGAGGSSSRAAAGRDPSSARGRRRGSGHCQTARCRCAYVILSPS